MNKSNLAILEVLERAPLRSVPVPKKYEQDWKKTRSNFLWTAPAFSHILYTMLVPDGGEHVATFTDEIPVAATDGLALYLHPITYFEEYTLHERVFILGHEVLHNMLNHCGLCHIYRTAGEIKYPDGTKLPYIHDLMGKTLDYVINALLVEDKIGKMPEDAHFDLNIATGKEHHLEVYRKLYLEAKQQGRIKPLTQPGNGGAGGGKPGGKGKGLQPEMCEDDQGKKKGFDHILEPGSGKGKEPSKAAAQRNEPEWKAAIAAGLAAAKAQGHKPSALERLVKEIMEPEISWNEHIEMFFARKVGAAGYDWKRPDRRWITRSEPIFVPASSGFGAETIVVAVDTSGSVGEREISLFFGELSGILEDVRPRRMIVIWCDAKVHRVDELEDAMELVALRGKGAPGGGGTSFVPVFDYIREQNLEPDCLVYLTDGLGTFPAGPPKYPTLWGSIYLKEKGYPFGDVVMIPKVAK